MAMHPFNVMSKICNRLPGLAGAAVDTSTFPAKLTAEGIHVDLATIGSDMKSFTLNRRIIKPENSHLTLKAGTLSGADLDMISVVHFMHEKIGMELGEALCIASLHPAEAVSQCNRLERLEGLYGQCRATNEALDLSGTWVDG